MPCGSSCTQQCASIAFQLTHTRVLSLNAAAAASENKKDADNTTLYIVLVAVVLLILIVAVAFGMLADDFCTCPTLVIVLANKQNNVELSLLLRPTANLVHACRPNADARVSVTLPSHDLWVDLRVCSESCARLRCQLTSLRSEAKIISSD